MVHFDDLDPVLGDLVVVLGLIRGLTLVVAVGPRVGVELPAQRALNGAAFCLLRMKRQLISALAAGTKKKKIDKKRQNYCCLLYTSPSPRD